LRDSLCRPYFRDGAEQAGFFQTRKAAEDRPTVLRVPVDESALFVGEGASFLQDGIGHADYADTVEKGRYFDLVEAVLWNIHLSCDTDRPLREASAVNAGVDVLQIDPEVFDARTGRSVPGRFHYFLKRFVVPMHHPSQNQVGSNAGQPASDSWSIGMFRWLQGRRMLLRERL